MATIRVGPAEIRDPQRRSLATHVAVARFTGVGWSAPGRIMYLQGLCQGDPPGISIEMEIRELLELKGQIDGLLDQAGLLPPDRGYGAGRRR